MPEEFSKIVEPIFEEERENLKNLKLVREKLSVDKINDLSRMQEKIESTIVSTTNPNLIRILEAKREKIEQEKKLESDQVGKSNAIDQEYLVNRCAVLFINPVQAWKE